jgi:GNAT superfamily N-acetyltransferase
MEVFVREFAESDRESLRELFVATRSAAFSWAPSSEHKADDFDIATEGERILVAVDADSVIGFASIWEADSFLHNLFVHPQFQRRGVGKALLAYCERYFACVPTLKCVKANEHARQFYQAQGWAVRSEAEGPEGPYLLMERVTPDKVTNNVSAVKPHCL